MNLGHHLTVRLQAFASYCMAHAEIKETQKGSGRDVKEKKKKNHIIIRTSFRKSTSTDRTDFVKPEEHAHHTQKIDKPRGQSRSSALWSKEALNICSCLTHKLPF